MTRPLWFRALTLLVGCAVCARALRGSRVALLSWRQWSVYAVGLALICCSCAGSLSGAAADNAPRRALARSSDPLGTLKRCDRLDTLHTWAGGVGKLAAVSAAGMAGGTIPAQTPEAQTGLAVGAMVAGAVAAGAVFVAESSATSWARECAQ